MLAGPFFDTSPLCPSLRRNKRVNPVFSKRDGDLGVLSRLSLFGWGGRGGLGAPAANMPRWQLRGELSLSLALR